MGRPIRLKAPDLSYHITSRTNGAKLFMKTKKDQKMLCRYLKQVALKFNFVIYAFTPMTNHFHLFIHITNEADLSKVIGEFKVRYAKYFNKKYGIHGHFWGSRFHSTIVQDDQYALACLRYMDRNPVKAGLVDHPNKWLLGSFRQYSQGSFHPILNIEPHPAYLALSKQKPKRQAIYYSFVLETNTISDELHHKIYRLQFLGSQEFIKEVTARI
jgi:putative transposase